MLCMQAADELGDEAMEVAGDDVEQPAGGKEGEDALERLECRDRAQSLLQPAVQR